MVPDVPMGRVVNLTSYRNTVMHGENITVECNHNYELEGNVTQIACNNGSFDRMPKCEPARCKTLPAPPKNGMVVVSCTACTLIIMVRNIIGFFYCFVQSTWVRFVYVK